MNVMCQWCDSDAEPVPFEMFPEHVHLMHSDEVAVVAVDAHGGSDVDELKAAYTHLCVAQAQCDRSDYSTGREYGIISEKLEFLIDEVMSLVTIVKAFQR